MRTLLGRILLLLSLSVTSILPLEAQKMFKPTNLARFDVERANYSGIVALGGDSFAIVDDKSAVDGFKVLHIEQDNSGKIRRVVNSPFRGDFQALEYDKDRAKADCEDIAYVSDWNTCFIASEYSQRVFEYRMNGERTGRELQIPKVFESNKINRNYGFEALTYNSKTKLFWLTTERPLLQDESGDNTLLRLQSFNLELLPSRQWAYAMEPPSLRQGVYYAHGIPALLALDDGRLLVMERELTVPSGYIGAQTRIRIFLVNPAERNPINQNESLKEGTPNVLPKTELVDFRTHLKLGKFNYGNYEGMALGRRLDDGRQTLLLICDSQNGAGNSFYRLKDFLKVVVLPSF